MLPVQTKRTLCMIGESVRENPEIGKLFSSEIPEKTCSVRSLRLTQVFS